MSRFMALLLCGWVVALPYGSVKAEIIIDNAASQPDVNAITMPIVEIRPIAAIDPTVIGFLGDFRFSRDLILQSAMRFPMIAEKLDSESKEHISFEDIQATVEASDYKDLYLFQENPTMRERYKKILVMSDLATVTPFKVWDATVIMNMLATGVIDTENVYYLSPSGEPGEFVGFNPLYTSSIINVYGTLPLITRQPVAEIPEQLRSLQKDVKQYNAMEQSMLTNIGSITFGRPIVSTAQERGLLVPESISREFDVYWLDLAVTFREIAIDPLSEMAINFALPEEGLALELVPLEYGLEIDVEEGKKLAGDIGVNVAGARISVGEVFNQSISFTYLRPIIAAYGLRESKFSWTIRGEAMRAGSHKFVAVVGVPKGSVGVGLAMTGHVRIEKSWLGKWYDGEVIAGTDTTVIYIAFQ